MLTTSTIVSSLHLTHHIPPSVPRKLYTGLCLLPQTHLLLLKSLVNHEKTPSFCRGRFPVKLSLCSWLKLVREIILVYIYKRKLSGKISIPLSYYLGIDHSQETFLHHTNVLLLKDYPEEHRPVFVWSGTCLFRHNAPGLKVARELLLVRSVCGELRRICKHRKERR